MGVSFAELIAPSSFDEFLSGYWQRAVFRSSTCTSAKDLVTLADIEFLVSSLTSTGPDWIRVVKSGSTLAAREICTDDAFISVPKVRGAYQAGYTVQLAKMHKRSGAVGVLCRDAENALTSAGLILSKRIGSHLYLTPPQSIGFAPHYDNHDVFVVQIAGAKRWKIYGSIEQFPLAMQRGGIPRSELPALEHDIVLGAGETLYIPRGVFHEAMAEDCHSVHVTLDVFPHTWADLVSRLATSMPEFREALPVGAWSTKANGTTLQGEFRRRVEQLLASTDAKSVATQMLDAFLAGLDPLPDDGFAAVHGLGSVNLDTVLERRPGAMPFVVNGDSAIRLRFPGAAIGAPPDAAALFEFLQERPRFAVSNLPDVVSQESKVQLARDLVEEGLLRIAQPAS